MSGAVKILARFPRAPYVRHPVRLLIKQRHAQVAPRAKLALRDVLEPRNDEHRRRPPVREDAHHARPPANLAVRPLDGVAGAGAVRYRRERTLRCGQARRDTRRAAARGVARADRGNEAQSWALRGCAESE